MNIVFMNGGLGNQTFQYIFLRYIELAAKAECIIDDSPFFGTETTDVPHNGYELEKVFGIKHRRLSEMFDDDVWEYMLSKRTGVAGIAQELADNGFELGMVYDAETFRFDGPKIPITEFNDDFFNSHENLYFHGYYLSDRYFDKISAIIRPELDFVSIPDDELSAGTEKNILQSRNPVCIHIRRGDMAKLGWCMGPEYFSKLINTYKRNAPASDYFLFSDDISWCQNHSRELGLDSIKGSLNIIDGHTGADAWKDLYLMSLCHAFLSDKSSFSLLAATLCRYEGKTLFSRWN